MYKLLDNRLLRRCRKRRQLVYRRLKTQRRERYSRCKMLVQLRQKKSLVFCPSRPKLMQEKSRLQNRMAAAMN